MKKIATIGFGKKSAERFLELLTGAGVTVVVDTRRRPDSPFSGYARQRDLPFILSCAGISYTYVPELAPSDTLLLRYREDKDWPAYVRDYEATVLDTSSARDAMRHVHAIPGVAAILCSEPTPDKCHRRLVVERMDADFGPLQIAHLV